MGVPAAGVPNEKPPAAGLEISVVDLAGVPKLIVDVAILGTVAGVVVVEEAMVVVVVGVPKEKPPLAALVFAGSDGFCVDGGNGSILPRPASLIGLLMSAEIPVIFGSCGVDSAGLDGGASTVSLTSVGAGGLATATSSSLSKSSLRQLSSSESLFFSTRLRASLSLLTIGDFSFGLMKLIRPPSSSSSSCSGSGSLSRICDSSYFLLNNVIRG